MSPDWEWEAEVQQRGRRLKADHTDRSRAEQRALSLDLRLQQLHDLKTLTAVLFVHQSSQARHYDVKKRPTNLICISLLRIAQIYQQQKANLIASSLSLREHEYM